MATGCYGNDVQAHDVQLALWQKIQTVQLNITMILGGTGTHLMQQKGLYVNTSMHNGVPSCPNDSNCDTFLCYQLHCVVLKKMLEMLEISQNNKYL